MLIYSVLFLCGPTLVNVHHQAHRNVRSWIGLVVSSAAIMQCYGRRTSLSY